ncbi:MAG: YhbY family RNA-binding protein [Acidobacteria bacterium]|nr:YhbY family RNA-binding protein [Acidobacteriota bacterium]
MSDIATDRLSGAQRKFLRGQAHHLKPLVQIGRQGLTEASLEHLEAGLADHELVKVKFLDFKDRKEELVPHMEQRLRAECVGVIGHTAIFYRRHHDPDKRKIKLP